MLEPIAGGYHTCLWTALFVEAGAVTATRDIIVKAIQAEGIDADSYGRYDLISTGLFQSRVARPWLRDERRMYPFVQPDGREYT